MAVEIDVKKLTDGFGNLTKAIETLDKRLEGLPKASTSALDLALGTPNSLDSYIASIGRLDKAVGKSFSSIVRELRLFTVASQKATTSGFSALTGALESIIKIADSLSFGSTGAINTEVVLQKLTALREIGDLVATFGQGVVLQKTDARDIARQIKGAVKNLTEAYDAIYDAQKGKSAKRIDKASIVTQMDMIYEIGALFAPKKGVNINNIKDFRETVGMLRDGIKIVEEILPIISNFEASAKGAHQKPTQSAVVVSSLKENVGRFSGISDFISRTFSKGKAFTERFTGDKELKVFAENAKYFAKMVTVIAKAMALSATPKYANLLARVRGKQIDYGAVAKQLNDFLTGLKAMQNVIQSVGDFNAWASSGGNNLEVASLDQIDKLGAYIKVFVDKIKKMPKDVKIGDVAKFLSGSQELAKNAEGIKTALIHLSDAFIKINDFANYLKLHTGKTNDDEVFAVVEKEIKYYGKVMKMFTRVIAVRSMARYRNFANRMLGIEIDYDAVAKKLVDFSKGIAKITNVLRGALQLSAERKKLDGTGDSTLDEITLFSKFVKRFTKEITAIASTTDVSKLRALEMAMRGIVVAISDTLKLFEEKGSQLLSGRFALKGVSNTNDIDTYIDKIADIITRLVKNMPKNINPDKMRSAAIMFKAITDSFPQVLQNITELESMFSLVKVKKGGFPISFSIFAKPNQMLKRLRFFSTLKTYVNGMAKMANEIPNKDGMKATSISLKNFTDGFNQLQQNISGIEVTDISKYIGDFVKIEGVIAQLRRFFRGILAWNVRTNDANRVMTTSKSLSVMVDAVKNLGDVLETMTPVLDIMEKFTAYNRRVRFLGVIRVTIKDLLGVINKISSSLKERPDELVNRLKTFALAIKNLGAGIRAIIQAQQELQGMFDEANFGSGIIGSANKFGRNMLSFGSNALANIGKGLTFGRVNFDFIRFDGTGTRKLLKQFEPLLKVIETFAKRLGNITSKIKDIDKIADLTRAMASIKRFLDFVNTIDIDTRGRIKRVTDSVRSGFGLFSRQNKNNLFGQAQEALKALKPFTKIVKSLKRINTGVIKEFVGFIRSIHKMVADGTFNFDFTQTKMSGFDTWAKNFSSQMQGGIRALARMDVNAKQMEKAKNAMLIAKSGLDNGNMVDVNKHTGWKARVPTLMPMADNDFLTENDAVRRGFAQRSGEMRRDFLQRIINDFTAPLIRNLAFANPFNVVRNLQKQIMTVFRDSGKIISEYANQVAMGAQNMMQMFNPTNLLRSQGFNLAVDYDALSSQLEVFGALNQEQLALAQQMANEIGVKYPLSANEALTATLDLLKAGQDLSKVQFILPASADLAALSESGDLGNVTQFLIGATNGYRKFSGEVASSFDSINVATDIVFRAANDSTAAVDSLMEGLLRVAPSASAFGLSLEETAALLTVFEDAGIRGQEAGTQLRAVLDELTMNGLNSREALDKILSGQTPSGLFEERFERQGLRILQSATAQGKTIDSLVEKYQAMGTAADASANLMDNLKGDIEQLKGSFETALTVAFVPTLERFFRPIVKVLRVVVDGFTGMNLVLRDTIVNGALITVMGLSLGATLTFVIAKVVALSGWFMHLVGGIGLAIMKAPMLITSLGGIVASFSVLATGIGILSAGFFFLADAVTQTFNAVEKNIGGAGDAFRNFASQTKVAFNEVGKLFGRVRVAYKTVFEKNDAKALQERGEVITSFFGKMSMRASNFIKSIRGITTVDILVFLENTKQRFGVIRGILQDLRIGWMGVVTGQETYLKRLNVGFAKILYSATDFVRKMTKISPEKAIEMIKTGDTNALVKNARFQQRLIESMTLFKQGDVIRGSQKLFNTLALSIRGVFERNRDRIADIGAFIFNSINIFKRLETGLRLFGQKDLANELKVINDQISAGVKGIIKTVLTLMSGRGILESIRIGFGLQAEEFVRQSVEVFKKIADGISQAFRNLGVTLSFNPLRGLFDTLKTIPFNAIQRLIDSFKALGELTLAALGGDMGAIAKVSGLSAAVITLVGPKVLGKFGGVFQTLKKFAKWLVIFEVIEAVTKNLDTLLNKNFFEGLTSVIADLSIGLLELLGLDEASINRVRGMFDEIGVIVQRTVDQIDRAITSLIINLEDSFPSVFGQSERTKAARQARDIITNTRPFLESPVGQQAVEFGFADMLRKAGVEEEYIDPINDLFKSAVIKATTEDSVTPLSEFFYRTINELKAAGISEENIEPFVSLLNTFSSRKTADQFGAGFMELISGGDLLAIIRREEAAGGQYSRDVGIQNAVFSYGKQLIGEQNAISFEQALSNLGQVARLDSAQISSNIDLAQMVLDEAMSLGIENLNDKQISDVIDIAKAMGDLTSKNVIQSLIDANLSKIVVKSFDRKLYEDFFFDVFSQTANLSKMGGESFAWVEEILPENLEKIAKTEMELNISVPEELIREQIYNGLKAGGEDFTATTLEIADMVRGVDTTASTFNSLEAINLLNRIANEPIESVRVSMMAGKTIEQIVAEALAAVEASPELKSKTEQISEDIEAVFPRTSIKSRQKRTGAQAILLAGSSRFTGKSANNEPEEVFTPMELTTNSRKGLIDLYQTVKAMTPTQVAENFQAITKNLQDMGIFADENSDIFAMFLEQLQSIYETNPELGDMSQAFSDLQSNIDIANKTLEQMGITIDSPSYQDELTKLLQKLGSLDDMGNIVIPITVTADAENLIGGLTPEEIQRMADLGNLIDDYTAILAGTSDGVIEAEKTVDDLIKEYSDASKSLADKTIETENELANMRTEFMDSEADAENTYNKDRETALKEHLKSMKEIEENDFKDAVANRNAASALEALQRQKEAKEQFDESEAKAKEEYLAERKKALNEYNVKQQEAQRELMLERQKLDALRIQRDNAIRLQLSQTQQEYNLLMAKVNANASTNESIATNTQMTMQQVATSIAGKLNEALRAVQNTPIGQAFGNIMTGILNTINTARIHTNIVKQGGFSGNQYNKPETNPNNGVIVIPPSFGGGRADGGKLMANRWYMTGEDGPEPLFMGSKSGYISTMKDVMKYQQPRMSASGGGVNVTVDLSNMQISGVQNATDIARQVEERVVKGITQAFKRSM